MRLIRPFASLSALPTGVADGTIASVSGEGLYVNTNGAWTPYEDDMARTAEYLESYDTKALPPSAPEGRVIATADGFMRREAGAWVPMPSLSDAAVFTAEQWAERSNAQRIEALLEHAYVLVIADANPLGEDETLTIKLPYADVASRVYGGRLVARRIDENAQAKVEIFGDSDGLGGGLGESRATLHPKGVARGAPLELGIYGCVELVVEPSMEQAVLGENTHWYQVS